MMDFSRAPSWKLLACVAIVVVSFGSLFQIGSLNSYNEARRILFVAPTLLPADDPHRSVFRIPISQWGPPKGVRPSHASSLLKVYVYDTLPAKFTSEVNECMFKRVTGETFSPESTKMADVAMISLFQTYPGRVYDPATADILVVPYPHTCHCLCAEGWSTACGQVADTEIDQLFDSLPYYNATTADRHLFVLSGNQFFMNQRIREQPLTLIGGYLEPHQLVMRDHGKIVMPYLNDKVGFQQVFLHDIDWWTRPRQYAFAYIFGPSNERNAGVDPRRVRQLFQRNVIRRNITSLGNMPFYLKSFDPSAVDAVWTAYDVYEKSIFCPILAGDSCQQARFFDVMMKGCIPVVLNYKETNINTHSRYKDSWAANDTSWYVAQGETTLASMPFKKGLFAKKEYQSDVEQGVDYESCVLQVDADRAEDVYKLVDVMHDVILNHPETIRKLQLGLAQCAPKIAFGMGSEAHVHNDAFSQVVQMIKYYLDNPTEKPNFPLNEASAEEISRRLNVSEIAVDPAKSMLATPIKERKPTKTGDSARHRLKVYVYDSLPKPYTADLEDCILEKATNEVSFHSASTKLADFALIKLFQSYPGRVDDPESADLFVVPYSHAGHCLCAKDNRYLRGCGQVTESEITEIFDSLTYYNKSTADRHVFLLSNNQYYSNERLMSQRIKLRGGYLEPDELVANERGNIILPHLNTRPSYQSVFTRPESWWTRDREYAFGWVSESKNRIFSGRDPQKVRTFFRNFVNRRKITSVAGKPFFMDGLSPNITAAEAVGIADYVYDNSVFCPMLAAGTAQQSQFFDAMAKGCIPVVMNYAETNINTFRNYKKSWATNLTSWYRPKAETTLAALPFKKGLLSTTSHDGSIDVGLDYDACVLQLQAEKEGQVRNLIDFMEDMLLNHPDTIQRLQRNLMKCAPKVIFGMGPNAHMYDDSFSQIVRMLELYVDAKKQQGSVDIM